ncbi:MAG: response regulator [Desulfotalea sp.]
MPNQEGRKISFETPEYEIFNILLIEEDDDIAQEMMLLFDNTNNISASHVTNSQNAISLTHQNSYDLVVLDINEGNDNNLDLISILRQHHPSLDFVTITSDNPKSIETKVRELRVLYHLVKPFSINEFSSVIRHISNRPRN